MKTFLRNNSPYLSGYLVLLVMMLAALGSAGKAELHLALNAYHAAWLDEVMKFITGLANWPLYALMLYFIVKRYSVVIYYVVCELSATAVVQVLKGALNMPRPKTFFGECSAELQQAFAEITTDGVRMHNWHSFPSGHTQTFFVFATVIALLLTYNAMRGRLPYSRKMQAFMQLGLLLFAALGGYSRIYLCQHFLADVCAGSAIGVLMPMLCWPVYLRLEKKLGDDCLCYRYFTDKKQKTDSLEGNQK